MLYRTGFLATTGTTKFNFLKTTELFRNKACLSATSGKDFVRKLKILTTNRSLALKIRENARKVYDEHYSLNNFSRIMKKCEETVFKES